MVPPVIKYEVCVCFLSFKLYNLYISKWNSQFQLVGSLFIISNFGIPPFLFFYFFYFFKFFFENLNCLLLSKYQLQNLMNGYPLCLMKWSHLKRHLDTLTSSRPYICLQVSTNLCFCGFSELILWNLLSVHVNEICEYNEFWKVSPLDSFWEEEKWLNLHS
jgi:hypothetical protein